MIQGCAFGYTQSDEITLILIDYESFNQEAWLNYEIQKMVSTAASMTTMYFNKIFERKVKEFINDNFCVLPFDPWSDEHFSQEIPAVVDLQKQVQIYKDAASKGAMFDARCFNVPKEEAANLIYWRQIDAMRNSVQMAARAHFSKSEIKDKTGNEMKKMLEKLGIKWEDYPINCQRGACCIQEQRNGDVRPHWYVDTEIPVFKGEARDYINRFIFVGEE